MSLFCVPIFLADFWWCLTRFCFLYAFFGLSNTPMACRGMETENVDGADSKFQINTNYQLLYYKITWSHYNITIICRLPLYQKNVRLPGEAFQKSVLHIVTWGYSFEYGWQKGNETSQSLTLVSILRCTLNYTVLPLNQTNAVCTKVSSNRVLSSYSPRVQSQWSGQ